MQTARLGNWEDLETCLNPPQIPLPSSRTSLWREDSLLSHTPACHYLSIFLISLPSSKSKSSQPPPEVFNFGRCGSMQGLVSSWSSSQYLVQSCLQIECGKRGQRCKCKLGEPEKTVEGEPFLHTVRGYKGLGHNSDGGGENIDQNRKVQLPPPRQKSDL